MKRRDIIIEAARKLDHAKMIRFDERTGYLYATDLGRTSSNFYIKYDTVEVFNEMLKPVMNEGDILAMLSRASEFEQLKSRDDEMDKLDDLTHTCCEVPVKFVEGHLHRLKLDCRMVKVGTYRDERDKNCRMTKIGIWEDRRLDCRMPKAGICRDKS